MPAGYAPLPNPRSEPEAEREMEEAFDSDHGDDEHHTESTPLTQGYIPTERPEPTALTIPGAYDFERDYDYPPPGSPPSPTAFALPNDIGNTNGQLPSAPVRPQSNRPSFFRRAVGALLPQHYARIPSGPAVTRPRGGGIENDGVFANVMAKPGRSVAVRDRNGEVYMVPEEVQNEMPPVSTHATHPFSSSKMVCYMATFVQVVVHRSTSRRCTSILGDYCSRASRSWPGRYDRR